MFTKNEVATLALSPTKKDFAQIWNELLEVAGKLSERWDPTSTNESDPGIVILKALAGIADKLNYNIDKNILEAFMPTAAQEESMRKLCEMLSYSPKYYQSATTSVTISWHNSDPSDDELKALQGGLRIPRFTVLKNNDQDINYFTTNTADIIISEAQPKTTSIPCMEGQIVRCESINDNYVITASQISEDNRFYLPEIEIAENGIFVYNIHTDNSLKLGAGVQWTKVDNLNIQARNNRVFKFGYDSYLGRPYIEFPEDYSELFNDGIFIYYTRTSGVNGNISNGVLTQLELPSSESWSKVKAESFSVENLFAATSGANIETIEQAYSNFKKTIGTFDTLVTCRDYMNKIYTMLDPTSGKPYVSNVLVTDIRNDINRAVTICSCDDSGIFYKERALTGFAGLDSDTSAVSKPVYYQSAADAESYWHIGSIEGPVLSSADFIAADGLSVFNPKATGVVGCASNGYWTVLQKNESNEEVLFKTKLKAIEKPLIDHFDLIIYPYKSYTQIKNNLKDRNTLYNASFNYDTSIFNTVVDTLKTDKYSTIAHKYSAPRNGDIVSINNYLRINALIATNTKVSVDEGNDILANIKIALANAFNMRELDFGEEIPLENIISVIENADPRIRIASLENPAVYTTFSVLDDDSTTSFIEYAVDSNWLTEEMAKGKLGENNTRETAGIKNLIYKKKQSNGNTDIYKHSSFNVESAKQIYNKLVRRNILAGKVPLFDYNNTFSADFSESTYRVTKKISLADWQKEFGTLIATVNEPYIIKIKDNSIYTCRLENGNSYDCTISTALFTDNTITSIKDLIAENETIPAGCDKIDAIIPFCELPQNDGKVSNITLENGEFVRFRAPNFETVKTYPAYVNYHLNVGENSPINPTGNNTDAEYAVAYNLYGLLSGNTVPTDNSEQNNTVTPYWHALFESPSFTDKHKQTFRLSQTMSRATSSDAIPDKGDIVIQLGNSISAGNVETKNIGEILAESGCVKLINKKATLEWTPTSSENVPTDAAENSKLSEINITLDTNDYPYITDVDVLTEIQNGVSSTLSALAVENKLPTSCSWTIYFEFEYIPFNVKNFTAWESFVNSGTFKELFGFEYAKDPCGGVFWRVFGNGYEIDKYVLEDGSKLKKLEKSHFDLLPDNRLTGVFVAKSLGSTPSIKAISNNTEYTLRDGDYLCIEYTPSSTAEGADPDPAAITEVYGKGTTIRPSGFSAGLVPSNLNREKTTFKDVIFSIPDLGTTKTLGVYSLGANEQIEIREQAMVELSDTSFNDNKMVYVYKNFSSTELERNSGKRSYTLKDNEYIFYTDRSKTDFAYFTSGTEVIINGNCRLPATNELVEIATIFEAGVEAIPWQPVVFTNTNDKITFKEFQYITLGAEDTINEISITATKEGYNNITNSSWTACSSADYTLSDGTQKSLPELLLNDQIGSGWEVTSILGLATSPSTAQSARSTDKIITGLELVSTSDIGGSTISKKLAPPTSTEEDGEATAVMPLQIKTNLPCQAGNSTLTIEDIYLNPDQFDSFQFKVFCKKELAIVETKAGRICPLDNTQTLDNWLGEPITLKGYQDIWNQVELDQIEAGKYRDSDSVVYDRGLRLSVCTLPKTYGIATFYVKLNTLNSLTENKVWLEFMPGTSHNDISFINKTVEASASAWEPDDESDLYKPCRFYLTPGINCIKFNNSCDFLVKATKGTLGTLFFDDLKLVKCSEIKYKLNGNDYSALTKGLNLAQLDYILIRENETPTGGNGSIIDDTIYYDEATKNELITSLYTDVKKNLEQEIAESVADCDNNAQKLLEFWPTVEGLKEDLERFLRRGLLNGVVANDYILDIDSPDSSLTIHSPTENQETLCTVCKDLENGIQKKLELLETLASPEVQIEKYLLEILKQFNSKELTQQQLLERLNIVTTQLTTNTSAQTSEAIINSFDVLFSSYGTQDYSAQSHEDKNGNELYAPKDIQNSLYAVIQRAKILAIQEYKTLFDQELLDLLNKFDQVTDSETKYKIAEILESLKNDFNNDSKQTASSLIDKLQTILDTDSINSLLAEIFKATVVPTGTTTLDFYTIVVAATKLKAIYESADINIIVEQLKDALLKNDNQLAGLVEELQSFIDSLSNIQQSVVLVKLNNLLSAAFKQEVDNVKTAADELRESISKDYVNQLKTTAQALDKIVNVITLDPNTILDQPSAVLITQLDTIAKELTEMDTGNATNSGDAELIQIVTDINSLIDYRSDFVSSIKNIKGSYAGSNEETISYLDVAEETKALLETNIVNIWPEYIHNLLMNRIIAPCRNLILDASKNNLDTLADSWISNFPKSFEVFLDLNEIKAIVATTKTINNVINKEEAVFETARRVIGAAGLACISVSETNPINTDGLNSLARQLITEINNGTNTVEDYQKKNILVNTLKTELENTIETERQLLTAVEAALYENAARVCRDFEISSYEYFLANKVCELIKNSVYKEGETPTFVNTFSGEIETFMELYKAFKILHEKTLFDDNSSAWRANLSWASWIDENINIDDLVSNIITKRAKWTALSAELSELESTPIDSLLGLVTAQETVTGDTSEAQDPEVGDELTILEQLQAAIDEIKANIIEVTEGDLSVLSTEDQLLADLLQDDIYNEFFYTVIPENSLAIELGREKGLATLMNPATYYDINNINNSFVISKLDMDYLDTGLRIARSSLLN